MLGLLFGLSFPLPGALSLVAVSCGVCLVLGRLMRSIISLTRVKGFGGDLGVVCNSEDNHAMSDAGDSHIISGKAYNYNDIQTF